MSKAEKFIRDCTRNCSNELSEINNTIVGKMKVVNGYQPWLTPDQAMKAVEIAREETLKEVKTKLQNMLQTSVDNQHFFEQLDDYIDELENEQ